MTDRRVIDGRSRFGGKIAIDLGGRIPPNNLEAEAAVLSSILVDKDALDSVLEFLQAEHFYSDANKHIFEVAEELHRKSQPVDIQTVAAVLKDRERLQAIGGISYMARIVDATPSVAHVTAHAKIVKEKARIRRLIETCQMVAATGYGDYGDAQEFIDQAEQAIYEIARTAESSTVAMLYDVIRQVMLDLDAAAQRGTSIVGVPSGFVDLDRKTGGMRNGDFIIVAARPGMGKTSYVLNIATHVAAHSMKRHEEEPETETQYGVLVFSLEMPRDQLAMRMIGSESRVNLIELVHGTLGPGKWDGFVDAANSLSQLSIWIDDQPGANVLEIRSKVRRKQAEFDKKRADGTYLRKIGLVAIDYLQLMRGRADAGNREQEVSEISRSLKAMAKECGLPVIALSQLNRECETRAGKDKRPRLSDLRESGSLEQDADVVQFIYRPEYYVVDKSSDEAQKKKGYAEVIIGKQRNGPVGKVPMTFIEEYTRFENRSREAWREDD